MGATRGYDPALIVMNVDGRDISGYADGTFVNIVRNADAFVLTVGADGEATRAKSNNRSGRITFTLQQSSPANDILDAIATQDELNNGGAVPVRVSDKNGTTVAQAEKMWVVKKPDSAYAKDPQNREWILETGQLDYKIGGESVL